MDILKSIENALKELIPKSSLPMEYKNHAELADDLVLKLSGQVVLVEKQKYDRQVKNINKIYKAVQDLVRDA